MSKGLEFFEDLSGLFRECVTFYVASGAPTFNGDRYVELSERLSLAMDIVAHISSSDIGDGGYLHPSFSNPGQLRLSVGADAEINVPYHVAPYLPGVPHLLELCSVAQMVKQSNSSTICLSGSALIYQIVRFIGDLDFCEYINDGRGVFRETLLDHIRRASVPKLYSFKLINEDDPSSKKKWCLPWCEFGEDSVFQDLKSRYQIGAFDYLARTRSFGALEVTNRALVVAGVPEETGVWNHSFALQEAPVALVNQGWVPRRLSSPFNVGKYLYWLYMQIGEYFASRNYGKCLKRAFPFLLLMNSPRANDLNQIIQAEELMAAVAISARKELLASLLQLNCESLREFFGGLEESIAQLSVVLNGNTDFSPSLYTRLDSFIAGIIDDFSYFDAGMR